MSSLYECGILHYDQMISKTLEYEKVHFRRIEALLSLCASIEEALFNKSLPREFLIDELGKVGQDLCYYIGTSGTSDLLCNILDIKNFCGKNKLWIQLGDTYRLKDDYERSRLAFSKAKVNAKNEIESFESEVGIASAKKNTRNGIQELEKTFEELRNRAEFNSYSGGSLVRALFQQANLSFATCNWNKAISLYYDAEKILNTNLRSHASLLIDIWKGLGDVFLHIGDFEEANKVCNMMMDLAAKFLIPFMDSRVHAKICQYIGDVLRHKCCETIIEANSDLVRISDWWYNKAIDLYASNELQLGVYLSNFKIAQNKFISKNYKEALDVFIDLREDFLEINNHNWVYKCDIMIVAISMCELDIVPSYLLEEVEINIKDAIKKNNLSKYQRAWIKLVIDKNKIEAINVSG